MNTKEKYLLMLNNLDKSEKSEVKVNEVPYGYG